MTAVLVKQYELPPVPAPKPGDDPVFEWHIVAEIKCGELTSQVKRFTYWDERDDRPLEVGFEAFIDGLPDPAGVADIVATHPVVFTDLAQISTIAAQVLRECGAP